MVSAGPWHGSSEPADLEGQRWKGKAELMHLFHGGRLRLVGVFYKRTEMSPNNRDAGLKGPRTFVVVVVPPSGHRGL